MLRSARYTFDWETDRLQVLVDDLGGRVILHAYLRPSLRGWLDRAVDPENDEKVASATYNYDTEARTVSLNWTNAIRHGKGYGRELLSAALAHFKKRGFKLARGFVESGNTQTEGMLRKLGFERQEETPTGAYWALSL
jgi:ribosomal protein S18 acetylase RimI-like enzyme